MIVYFRGQRGQIFKNSFFIYNFDAYLKFIRYVCVCECTHATVSMWSSEDSFQVSAVSFHHGSSGDQTPVVRVSGEHLRSHGGGRCHWGEWRHRGRPGVSSCCASRNTNLGLTGVRSSGQRV